MVHISAPRTQVHLNILERLFTRDRKEECYIGPFCSFLTQFERTFFSVSSLFFSIYLKERQLSIRIGSFPAVCPSGRVSRGTNKRGDSLLTWTRAFLGGPKIQFSMESGVRQTDDMQGKAKRTVTWYNIYSPGSTLFWMAYKFIFTCDDVTSIFESPFSWKVSICEVR